MCCGGGVGGGFDALLVATELGLDDFEAVNVRVLQVWNMLQRSMLPCPIKQI